jgi:hypothetical protein
MVVPDLIAHFVTPLDAIVLPLLSVFDPVGPVRLAVACSIRTALHTIGAISCDVGAIISPSRTIFAGRKLTGCRTARATSAL